MKELIICGCPRSGTTALAALLSHDKKTLVMNECGNLVWDKNKFKDRLKAKSKEKLFGRWLREKNINPTYFINNYYRYPRLMLEMLAYDYSFEVVGDKCNEYILPENFNRINHTNRYYIFTVRDCRDFVASSLTNYSQGVREQWTFDNVESACECWSNYVEAIINTCTYNNKIKYKMLKYEKWCDRPEQLVLSLSRFMDYDFKIPNPRGGWHPVHLGRWKQEIPDIKLTPRAHKLMEELLYYAQDFSQCDNVQ